MKNNKEKVLIIGGMGFIGHNLALKLSTKYDVLIVDAMEVNNLISLNKTAKENPNFELYSKIIKQRINLIETNNISLKKIDARNYEKISEVFNNYKPDYVFHLAAVAHANVSNKDPYSTFDHSLRTLENSLDNSRNKNQNIKRFIYLSSSMIYGNFKGGIVDEDTICNPLGIYGALKFSGEKMVIGYNQVFDLPYTIVRPSALYGPRCISRRVIQIFIENAMKNKDIFIDDDGKEKLDFTYIDDFIQGLEKILIHEASNKEIFNLTFGQARSIIDVVNIIKKEFTNLNVISKPRDKLMPIRGTLSIEKAKQKINYLPSFDIEKGIKEYINFYKNIS
tara:strand:+ start:1387 stop:2394 length:1008 start_codon:yes stop_codon:yes gene_type:complete